MQKYTPARWLLLCLCGYFLLGLHAVIPNNGGTQGDSLPWVLTGWMMLCLMVAGVWWGLPRHQALRVTSTFMWLVAASLLLTLPLLWSPHPDWQINALPRLAGLWGGVAVYFTLLQCRLSATHWRMILAAIAISTVTQALFVLTEIFFPAWVPVVSQNVMSTGLNYGVFQQRNVTASFLATGLIILTFLLTDARAVLVNRRVERFRVGLLAGGTLLLSATLVLLNSRVGWLGSVLALLLFSLLLWRSRTPLLLRHRAGWVLALPVLGALLGYGLTLMKPELGYVVHDASNSQRWLTLKASVQMLAEHPLSGWGYGGFEYAFQHWVITQNPPVLSREMMNHPHNEILFWGVEGGLVALLGLGGLIIAGIRLIATGCTLPRLALSLCLIPVLLHTQLEYPLYQSLAHWLIVILLLVNLDEGGGVADPQPASCGRKPAQLLIVLVALAGVGLTAMALRNEIVLTAFELRQLPDDSELTHLPLPWLAESRYQQDRALLEITRFEKTNNPAALEEFVKRGRRWLQTREDADMYNNLIDVERYLGQEAQTGRDVALAARLFPFDERFAQPGAVK